MLATANPFSQYLAALAAKYLKKGRKNSKKSIDFYLFGAVLPVQQGSSLQVPCHCTKTLDQQARQIWRVSWCLIRELFDSLYKRPQKSIFPLFFDNFFGEFSGWRPFGAKTRIFYIFSTFFPYIWPLAGPNIARKGLAVTKIGEGWSTNPFWNF